jgi:hypothetical protein
LYHSASANYATAFTSNNEKRAWEIIIKIKMLEAIYFKEIRTATVGA